jgi:phosphatidylglycerol:prolipoprotein diacylglycerol transferase
VVLYDGLKNFLIIPILWWVMHRGVPPGRIASLFVLLYAALRIPIDMLREYPISFLFLPAGQMFNVLMALAGAALLAKNVWWPAPDDAGGSSVWRRSSVGTFGVPRANDERRSLATMLALAALIVFAVVIPSDATRDLPARYGHRHAGLSYSWLYPRIGIEPQMVGRTCSSHFSVPGSQFVFTFGSRFWDSAFLFGDARTANRHVERRTEPEHEPRSENRVA